VAPCAGRTRLTPTPRAHDAVVTSGSPAPLRSVGVRAPLLPGLLLGLALGLIVGLGLGHATSVTPAPTASPAAGASPSATTSAWVTNASVAPGLLQAYYATRVTSAGVAPVVCTADPGLVCQGVPAYSVAYVENGTPASPQIPGPAELWTQLGPAHLARAAGAVHAFLIDDLSPALYSQVDILGPGEPWTDNAPVTSVSVNGAVVAMDLGRLGAGQYVVLIRQVFSVPPDRQGLVEHWKAIGLEVDR
jgi:hypothetical protein